MRPTRAGIGVAVDFAGAITDDHVEITPELLLDVVAPPDSYEDAAHMAEQELVWRWAPAGTLLVGDGTVEPPPTDGPAAEPLSTEGADREAPEDQAREDETGPDLEEG